MAKITCNGKEVVSESSLLRDVVASQLPKGGNAAVAVNDTFVPKSNWDSTELHDGDKVLIITATYGG